MHQTEDRPLRSYVFVSTEPGKTRTAARGMSELDLPGCSILTVDQVIGGCDIIAKIETVDLDCLARVITDGIREVDGVLDVVASWYVDRHEALEAQFSGRPERSLVSVS